MDEDYLVRASHQSSAEMLQIRSVKLVTSSTSLMSSANQHDIDALIQRNQQLELIAQEYTRLENLIEYAAQGRDLIMYAGDNPVYIDVLLSVSAQLSERKEADGYSFLYADFVTRRIINFNSAALALLGYSRDELLKLTIRDLESVPGSAEAQPSSTEVQNYAATYRHRLGHQVVVRVFKRIEPGIGDDVVVYRLEDRSLHKRLWRELHRREASGFDFQQALKALNAVTLELSRIDDFDSLCRQTVEFASRRLEFERVGMWFADLESHTMSGSYGVDEFGGVRSEHDQRWTFGDGSFVMDFARGKTEAAWSTSNSPIFNQKSEVIGYGWHIAAPILSGSQFIGILTCDNYLSGQPIKEYEPELLYLYAQAVGGLMESIREREQRQGD